MNDRKGRGLEQTQWETVIRSFALVHIRGWPGPVTNIHVRDWPGTDTFRLIVGGFLITRDLSGNPCIRSGGSLVASFAWALVEGIQR